MSRHTQIIGTLGPASDNESMITKMVSRGLNVARINCSHGDHKQHEKMIELVRLANEKTNSHAGIMLDLTGYRIRVGDLKKRRTLVKDAIVWMSNEPEGEEDHIPFDYIEDVKTMKAGMGVFIDDGRLQLKVIGHAGKKVKLKVIQGGLLKERKGINIPALKFQANVVTEDDEKDLEFGLNQKVDFIAQSFVRNKKDVQRVVDAVRSRQVPCKVIAKIETEEAVKNVDNIIQACDGVMVARGDLGVTLPLYKIPVIQKYIIRHCNQKKKISITATQMLESMISNGRPTRAEVSDVANAILDGTDYVMLSSETAVGKYPSRSVQVMGQIIEYTERYQDSRPK